MDLTWHTGTPGDKLTLTVDWFDENNVHHTEIIIVEVLPIDKPRQICITGKSSSSPDRIKVNNGSKEQ